jgi:hypothetical protein
MMRIRPLLLVALLLLGGTLTARPAAACTCGPFDARKALSEAPAGFVGTLIARDPLSGSDESTQEIFRFQVDQAVKGDLEPIVAVRSEKSEASCGLAVSHDQPVGLILYEVDGRWHSNLCRQTSPERLTRAAQPLPEPDGPAPPEMMLASTYGGGRATGLKFDGRLTGFGAGAGRTLAASTCPDRRHVAELFTAPAAEGPPIHGVAVRATDTMAVVFERMMPEFQYDAVGPTAVACRSAEGREVLVAVRTGDDQTGRSQVLRVTRPAAGDAPEGKVAMIWQGEPYAHAAFGPAGAVAYLGLAPSGERLMAVDLSGSKPAEARPVADLPPGAGAVTVSPDGKRLATVAVSPSQPTKVATIDLTSPVATPRIYPLSGVGIGGQMLWSGNDRVVFAPRIRPDVPVLVFDLDMRVAHSWANWVAERSLATAGGLLLGAGPDPAKPNTTLLRAAALDTGVVTVLREIEDALVSDIVDLTDQSATRAGNPPSGRTEVPTTTTTAPSTSPATRPPSRQPPAATVTSSALGDTTATTSPERAERPDTTRPGEVTTTTTGPAGERPEPDDEEDDEQALPGPSRADHGGGGGWLSGWILLALILGVGGALAAAAMLSGGLTAMTKRTDS